MTPADRLKAIRKLPDEWARGASPESIPTDGADLVIELVRRYNYDEPEIRVLIESVLSHAVAIAARLAEARGRELERAENPAMRSVGSAVAVARQKDRVATRAVLDEVFQQEVQRGTNPLYAFTEALRALDEGRP